VNIYLVEAEISGIKSRERGIYAPILIIDAIGGVVIGGIIHGWY
jgi:hypothetical protein